MVKTISPPMWKLRAQVFNFVTYPYAKASGCGHVIKTHTP